MSARSSSSTFFFKRFASATLSASLGAALGYLYARYRLPPEVATAQVVGMYASGGAVLAVFSLRLGTLLGSVLRDFLSRRR